MVVFLFPKFLRDLLSGMRMLEYFHLSMLTAIKPTSNPVDDHPVDQTLYRQLTGSLQYITFTRQGTVHAKTKPINNFNLP